MFDGDVIRQVAGPPCGLAGSPARVNCAFQHPVPLTAAPCRVPPTHTQGLVHNPNKTLCTRATAKVHYDLISFVSGG